MPDEEKTEQATPKKKKEAREEGQVAKSIELNTVVILISALIFYYFTIDSLSNSLSNLFVYFFNLAAYMNLNVNSFLKITYIIIYKMLDILMPFFIIMVIVSVLVNVAQVGFMITPKAIEAKLEKINPINGFKNMFSVKSFGELIKSTLKAFVVSYILYLFIKAMMSNWVGLIDASVVNISINLGKSIFLIIVYVILFMFVMAILDYLLQRYSFEKNIRMSPKEIKDEYKQMEGDPLIKNRIKRMQMELARHRMMEDVKTADVIITNPTHYAVALKYDEKKMPAPTVVAKGINKIAQRIKEIAVEFDITIVENSVLAQEIYKKVDIGSTIPYELYKATAQVLAYVYRIRGS